MNNTTMPVQRDYYEVLSVTKTSDALGVHRNTLTRKIKELELKV